MEYLSTGLFVAGTGLLEIVPALGVCASSLSAYRSRNDLRLISDKVAKYLP